MWAYESWWGSQVFHGVRRDACKTGLKCFSLLSLKKIQWWVWQRGLHVPVKDGERGPIWAIQKRTATNDPAAESKNNQADFE
jgi:hypothetical protein